MVLAPATTSSTWFSSKIIPLIIRNCVRFLHFYNHQITQTESSSFSEEVIWGICITDFNSCLKKFSEQFPSKKYWRESIFLNFPKGLPSWVQCEQIHNSTINLQQKQRKIIFFSEIREVSDWSHFFFIHLLFFLGLSLCIHVHVNVIKIEKTLGNSFWF